MRRRSDSALNRLLRLRPWSSEHQDPVAAGQGLLLATGLIVAATAPLLAPDRAGWKVLLTVSAAMTGLLLASLLLPWRHLHQRWTLSFPILVWAALAALGLCGTGLATPYGGLFVMCFAYTGLTQPAKTSLRLTPLAAGAYLAAMDGWSGTLGVRLLIALCVWVLLSQLLADFAARQRSLSEALQAAAHTDSLTGLGNRRAWSLETATAKPGDVVVLCDLDQFKQLNDVHGHDAGDVALAAFGRLLREAVRREDCAVRYGGEEFALLLPRISVAEAERVLARLRDRWLSQGPLVTFSAGVASVRQGKGVQEAMRAADGALYAAKRAGRNRDCRADSVDCLAWGVSP